MIFSWPHIASSAPWSSTLSLTALYQTEEARARICTVAQLYWDQNLVIDVFHEFLAHKPIAFRSCWVGFGRIGDNSSCFSDCCRTDHPFGLRPGSAKEGTDTMGYEIEQTLQPRYMGYECAPSSLGACSPDCTHLCKSGCHACLRSTVGARLEARAGHFPRQVHTQEAGPLMRRGCGEVGACAGGSP